MSSNILAEFQQQEAERTAKMMQFNRWSLVVSGWNQDKILSSSRARCTRLWKVQRTICTLLSRHRL